MGPRAPGAGRWGGQGCTPGCPRQEGPRVSGRWGLGPSRKSLDFEAGVGFALPSPGTCVSPLGTYTDPPGQAPKTEGPPGLGHLHGGPGHVRTGLLVTPTLLGKSGRCGQRRGPVSVPGNFSLVAGLDTGADRCRGERGDLGWNPGVKAGVAIGTGPGPDPARPATSCPGSGPPPQSTCLGSPTCRGCLCLEALPVA